MDIKKNIPVRFLITAIALFTMSACSSYERFPGQNEIAENKARAAAELEKEIPMIGVSTTCVTHKSGYVHSYYVQEPFSSNMEGGGNCGGLVAGGYRLPIKWQPRMKVKVRWNRPIKGEDNWIEKHTTIMPYTKAGTLYVHFFANDQVRVISSAYATALSPDHPILRDALTPPPEVE
ncbi:DUF3304 domain-containing protein [Iodobacter sp. CM08]|uniref:DUF3304 domain-containing protein n=1 Tax=Iodobacter sp. CM08 TaxID=3085902 RepID=UPI002980E846|nr:DUF3304 domain-containing protein [Iodobacter sp. CM08]MDW5417095.1 DUF3304 domain-containing protein [Iodobacter sp. CM08]